MKVNIGIWLDSEKAVIIENKKDKLETISSEIEHFHLHGGSKGKTPYGTQDATSETKLLERKKLQTKRYFDKIISRIGTADKIVVFGPAETKLGFQKNIEMNNQIKDKLVGVETVGNKLTENQLKEWVRNFYGE
ncbi:MAG: hypothetical protein GQ574_24885 [Crocinitomix sp.]|nr:hypothetical protein [Crocinitomix sp.]